MDLFGKSIHMPHFPRLAFPLVSEAKIISSVCDILPRARQSQPRDRKQCRLTEFSTRNAAKPGSGSWRSVTGENGIEPESC